MHLFHSASVLFRSILRVFQLQQVWDYLRLGKLHIYNNRSSKNCMMRQITVHLITEMRNMYGSTTKYVRMKTDVLYQ